MEYRYHVCQNIYCQIKNNQVFQLVKINQSQKNRENDVFFLQKQWICLNSINMIINYNSCGILSIIFYQFASMSKNSSKNKYANQKDKRKAPQIKGHFADQERNQQEEIQRQSKPKNILGKTQQLDAIIEATGHYDATETFEKSSQSFKSMNSKQDYQMQFQMLKPDNKQQISKMNNKIGEYQYKKQEAEEIQEQNSLRLVFEQIRSKCHQFQQDNDRKQLRIVQLQKQNKELKINIDDLCKKYDAVKKDYEDLILQSAYKDKQNEQLIKSTKLNQELKRQLTSYHQYLQQIHQQTLQLQSPTILPSKSVFQNASNNYYFARSSNHNTQSLDKSSLLKLIKQNIKNSIAKMLKLQKDKEESGRQSSSKNKLKQCQQKLKQRQQTIEVMRLQIVDSQNLNTIINNQKQQLDTRLTEKIQLMEADNQRLESEKKRLVQQWKSEKQSFEYQIASLRNSFSNVLQIKDHLQEQNIKKHEQINRMTSQYKSYKSLHHNQYTQSLTQNQALQQQIQTITTNQSELKSKYQLNLIQARQYSQSLIDSQSDLQLSFINKYQAQTKQLQQTKTKLQAQIKQWLKKNLAQEDNIRYIKTNYQEKQNKLQTNFHNQKTHLLNQLVSIIKLHQSKHTFNIQCIQKLQGQVKDLNGKLDQKNKTVLQLQEWFVQYDQFISKLKINLAKSQESLFLCQMQLQFKETKLQTIQLSLRQLESSSHKQLQQTQQNYKTIINLIQQNYKNNFKQSSSSIENIITIRQKSSKLLNQINDLDEKQEILFRQFDFNLKLQEKQKEIYQLQEISSINQLNFYKKQKQYQKVIVQNEKMINKLTHQTQSKTMQLQTCTALNIKYEQKLKTLTVSLAKITSYRNNIYEHIQTNTLLTILSSMEQSLYNDDSHTNNWHDLMRMIAYKEQFSIANIQQENINKQKAELQKISHLQQIQENGSQFKKMIDRLELSLKKQVQENKKMKIQMEKSQLKLSRKQQEINVMKRNSEMLERHNVELKRNNDEERAKLIEKIRKSEQQVNRYKSQFQVKKQESSQILLGQANTMKQYLKEAQNRIENYKQMLKQKQSKQKQSYDHIIKLQQKLKSLQLQHHTLSKNTKSLELKNQELQEQLSDYQKLNILNKVNVNQHHNYSQNHDDTIVRQKYEQLEMECMSLEMKLQQEQGYKQRMDNQILQLKRFCDAMKAENIDLNNLLRNKQNQSKNRQTLSANTQLNAILKQNSILKQKYQQQLKQNQLTIAQLLNQIQHLQSHQPSPPFHKQQKQQDLQRKLQLQMYQNIKTQLTLIQQQNQRNKQKIKKLQQQLNSKNNQLTITRSKSRQRDHVNIMSSISLTSSIKEQKSYCQSNSNNVIFNIPCILSSGELKERLVRMIEQVTKKTVKQTKIFYKCQEYCKIFSLNTVKLECLNQSFLFLLKSKDNIFAIFTSKFQTNQKPSAVLLSLTNRLTVMRKNRLQIQSAIAIDQYGEVTIANGLIKIKSRQFTYKEIANKYFEVYDKTMIFGKEYFRDDFKMELEMVQIYRVSLK